MKLFILTTVLFLLGFNSFSQVADTSKIKLGETKILIIKNHDDTTSNYDDFDLSDTTECEDDGTSVNIQLDVSIGANGYMSTNNSLGLPKSQSLMELDYSKSRMISFNARMKGVDIIKDRLYISPGIGLTYNGYKFKNSIDIGTNNDTLLFSRDSIKNASKYKLKATYLQIPLVIGIRLGNLDNNPLGIEFGVIGGYKIGSRIKEKFELNDVNYKNKIKDDFNINPFRLDATASIGIGSFGVFARYGLTSLFIKDKAPELIPFSVGITVGGF